jgi:hypothetical protein
MKDLKKHAISEYQDLYNTENNVNGDGESKNKKKKKRIKNKKTEAADPNLNKN